MRWINSVWWRARSVEPMENLAALLAALAFSALYLVLFWLVGRGVHAGKTCASCSLRPVCETGAVVDCPNVRRLRQEQ